MSWRFIFVVLLIAAGASAWGGVHLGDWLVAHGPQAPVKADRPELSTVPVLDANGRPYVAQPPQPLVDGRLAVPEAPPEIAWEIPKQSLTETDNPVIDLATTTITMMEAQQIAAAGNQQLQGIADVGDLGLGSGAATSSGARPLQPIEPVQTAGYVAPAARSGTQNNSWQASLRQDLQACSALGFFERPSCAWAARNKYCEPNKGWGKSGDCPAKSF